MGAPLTDPRPPDSFTQEELTQIGFTDSSRALRILRSLPGQGVTDDLVADLMPSLMTALSRSPDPDRALNNFDRWTNAVTSRYTHIQYLTHHPAALEIFFNVCGTSQLFSDILTRNPEYFEILANPGVRGGVKSGSAPYRELSSFVDSVLRNELKLEAMRRFKQRELLRIGTRDILGLSDMPSTAREFSNLADACLQKAYELGVNEVAPAAESHPAFAVIAMGKLGGQELNYSSDIDLMFVMGNEEEHAAFAAKLAEFIVNALSKNLQNGHLFRVDMRLRPEGRFGALVRTLASYRAYYESWAEPWELQSLIKARFVAGNSMLGQAFMNMVSPFVYRRNIDSEILESIRRNKRGIERKAAIQKQSETNVKLGFGGIRDIEFLAQALQLQLGGRNPLVRTPNTLEALAKLRQTGALTADEYVQLSDDYRFLRTVEHRLQILYELQTQTMPTYPIERHLLARRMGFESSSAFDEEYRERTSRVNAHLERIFYGGREEAESESGEWSGLLESLDTSEAASEVENRLSALGFREPDRIRRLIDADISGTQYGRTRPESQALFIDLAPSLIASAARTGDPDNAFDAVEALALAFPNRAELYRSLSESPELLRRICALGASAPPLIQSLTRHLEWMDLLVSEEIVDPAVKPRAAVLSELKVRMPRRKGLGIETFWDSLALFLKRERLRIAARDIWGEINCSDAGKELSAVADSALEILLGQGCSLAADTFPSAASALESVAVIGLGKLGGEELGYGSDWDILLVFDESVLPVSDSEVYPALNALAEFILSANRELQTRGAGIEIDPRLRAEGRYGALIRTLGEYEKYYREDALTWERQVLTKARFSAGSVETGRRYLNLVHAVIYEKSISPAAQIEIQDMKLRIEKERLKPEEKETDLKLGHGGMSDIEFTTQLWQLREGWRNPPVRSPSTVEALLALGSASALRGPDSARLADTHSFLTCVRNRLTLLGSNSTDVIPSDPSVLRSISVGMGFADSPEKRAEDLLVERAASKMKEIRQLTERLFYKAPVPE